MLAPRLFWVSGIEPHRIALMARPRGGEWLSAELQAMRDHGVTTVVSLLEVHEARELELHQEQVLCESPGLRFFSFPIQDRGTPPSVHAVEKLISQLETCVHDGKVLAIHCRAGIGRTGLIAACLLNRLGLPFDKLFAMLSQSRKIVVPDTREQIEWTQRFCHVQQDIQK